MSGGSAFSVAACGLDRPGVIRLSGTPEGFDAAKKKIEAVINSFLVEQDAPRITGVVLDYWGVR